MAENTILDCTELKTDELIKSTAIIPDEVNGVLKLRDYQIEAVDCAYEAWRDYDAIMLVLATGLGKTVLAADIVNRWPESAGRILFVAHIKELIHQAQERIEVHTTDRPAVEMGQRRGETGVGKTILGKSKVVVASIQTLAKRMKMFDPMEFGLIIYDEFHHSGADSYRRVWNYFQAGNESIKLLGITATPYRGDKISLGCIAEHCAYEMDIRDGIDAGWLVPIKQKYIVVEGLDFSRCRTVARDLNEGDLAGVMMGGTAEEGMSEEERFDLLKKQEAMLHRVAAPTIKEAAGRPTLVFCVTVEHATRMAEIFNRYPGVTAAIVHGATPKDQRDDIVRKFRAGVIQVLCGVGVFTEGFDAPNVAVIAMARPTKQQGLYVQMIGRGTRPLGGVVDRHESAQERQEAIANSRKSCCTVLDYVGNSGKHKLISTADVLAGDMPEELLEKVIDDMRRTGRTEDIREAAWRKKAEMDEEERRKQEERKKADERKRKEAEQREHARRERLRAEAQYKARDINPFDNRDQSPERVQPKFRGGATDAQIKLLGRLGIKPEHAMVWSKQQAGAVIDKRSKERGGNWYMRYGKYTGTPLREIPHAYLKWMGQNCQEESFQLHLALYREEWLATRNSTPRTGGPDAAEANE